MTDIKEGFLLWFTNSLIKITSGSSVNNEIKQNQRPLNLAAQQLAEELQLLENLKK